MSKTDKATKEILQTILSELKKEIDALPDDTPEPEDNGTGLFYPKVGEKFFNELFICGGKATQDWNVGKGAAYRTKDNLDRYREAFRTIQELHALSDKGGKWSVIDRFNELMPDDCWIGYSIHVFTFGRFSTKERAQAAIDKIGKERIQQCVNVLTMRGDTKPISECFKSLSGRYKPSGME